MILEAVVIATATFGWPHQPLVTEQFALNNAMHRITRPRKPIDEVMCFPVELHTTARWACTVKLKNTNIRRYIVRVYQDGRFRPRLVFTTEKRRPDGSV